MQIYGNRVFYAIDRNPDENSPRYFARACAAPVTSAHGLSSALLISTSLIFCRVGGAFWCRLSKPDSINEETNGWHPEAPPKSYVPDVEDELDSSAEAEADAALLDNLTNRCKSCG